MKPNKDTYQEDHYPWSSWLYTVIAGYIHIKAGYDTPTTNIILNGENINEIKSVESGMKWGFLLSPFFFSILPETLAEAIRQEKKIKGIQIE